MQNYKIEKYMKRRKAKISLIFKKFQSNLETKLKKLIENLNKSFKCFEKFLKNFVGYSSFRENLEKISKNFR